MLNLHGRAMPTAAQSHQATEDELSNTAQGMPMEVLRPSGSPSGTNPVRIDHVKYSAAGNLLFVTKCVYFSFSKTIDDSRRQLASFLSESRMLSTRPVLLFRHGMQFLKSDDSVQKSPDGPGSEYARLLVSPSLDVESSGLVRNKDSLQRRLPV